MRQYSAGEVVIRENEPGESAYVIEKGKVEISKQAEGNRVHIAFLEAGGTFGEMSMIDEMPRSATVTAIEETLVREIHRDDLYENMKANPDAVLKMLKRIFERLREANIQLAQLAGLNSVTTPRPQLYQVVSNLPEASTRTCTLEAMTPEAIESISKKSVTFHTFPFKIGRKSKDPMVNNHLEIQDKAPLVISRHHVSIVRDGDRIGVVDRGSQLGARVDELRVGGKDGPGPVYFQEPGGILVLGPDASPYRFKITIQ